MDGTAMAAAKDIVAPSQKYHGKKAHNAATQMNEATISPTAPAATRATSATVSRQSRNSPRLDASDAPSWTEKSSPSSLPPESWRAAAIDEAMAPSSALTTSRAVSAMRSADWTRPTFASVERARKT